MAWIRTIADADASDELSTLYECVGDPVTGRVDAIMRIHSLHPEGLATHFAYVNRIADGLGVQVEP